MAVEDPRKRWSRYSNAARRRYWSGWGLHRDEASSLEFRFAKRHGIGLPRVTVKLAASLDGKTALSNGVSKWITWPESRRVQRLRLRSCALVTDWNHIGWRSSPNTISRTGGIKLRNRGAITAAIKSHTRWSRPFAVIGCLFGYRIADTLGLDLVALSTQSFKHNCPPMWVAS